MSKLWGVFGLIILLQYQSFSTKIKPEVGACLWIMEWCFSSVSSVHGNLLYTCYYVVLCQSTPLSTMPGPRKSIVLEQGTEGSQQSYKLDFLFKRTWAWYRLPNVSVPLPFVSSVFSRYVWKYQKLLSDFYSPLFTHGHPAFNHSVQSHWIEKEKVKLMINDNWDNIRSSLSDVCPRLILK